MKKALFPIISFVLLTVVSSSCKKNSTTNTVTKFDTVNNIITVRDTVAKNVNDTIRLSDTTLNFVSDSTFADIDGVPYTTTLKPVYESGINIAQNGDNVVGFESYDAAGDAVVVEILTTKNVITTGTYGAFGDNTSQALLELFNTTTGYESATFLNPATITIDSIGNNTFKGRFQGTIYFDGDSTQTGANKKVITNGTFNVKVS